MTNNFFLPCFEFKLGEKKESLLVCLTVCVYVYVCQRIKGQAMVLAGCGWNVTRLTAPCCGSQIPPLSPAKDLFSPVCRHRRAEVQLDPFRQVQRKLQGDLTLKKKRGGIWGLWRFLTQNSAAVDCAVTLKGNFIWLTETCMREREGSVCFFSTRGSVTWSVREFSIQIFLCNWRTLSTLPRVCVFIGVCIPGVIHKCVLVHVLMCVSDWRDAKVNRSLVSVENAFLDVTGHVQA